MADDRIQMELVAVVHTSTMDIIAVSEKRNLKQCKEDPFFQDMLNRMINQCIIKETIVHVCAQFFTTSLFHI